MEEAKKEPLKVSIITAVYNRQDTIGSCIKSYNQQTYINKEQVFIDGASTDSTQDIIVGLMSSNDRLISEPDSGIYDAINKGIRACSGDVIGLLHSDDWFYDSDVLQRVMDEFLDESVEFVYGDLNYVAKDSQNVVRKWISGEYKPSKLKYGWMPPHPTVFVRKSLIDKLGIYNIGYRISADYDFLLRCFIAETQPVYINKPLVNMQTGGISNSKLSNIIIKSSEDYEIVKANHVGGILTIIFKNIRKVTQFFN